MIDRFIRRVKDAGWRNTIIGSFKMAYYTVLQKKYSFYEWNVRPYEIRPYLHKIAEIINTDHPTTVVDIGCGLGELLRHIDAENKYGYDIGENDIRAAKYLDKKSEIKFSVGSFQDIIINGRIDYVVTVNFLHGSREDKVRPEYCKFLSSNSVERIIVDVVPEEGEIHKLDFKKIFPDNYRKIAEYGPFFGERYIQVYEKNGN